jgi:hypothetical protein
MPGLIDIPGTHILRALFPVAMASATTNDEYPGVIVPDDATIIGVTWTPLAAVTANATNFTTVAVRNRGAAAAGTNVVASRSYAATDSVAYVPEAMTLGNAAAVTVAAGDLLTVRRVATASGLTIPAGLIEIAFRFR